MEFSDDIYTQEWVTALSTSTIVLETSDMQLTTKFRSPSDFWAALPELEQDCPSQLVRARIQTLYPILHRFESYSDNSMASIEKRMDVSLIWGMLHIIFKVLLPLP